MYKTITLAVVIALSSSYVQAEAITTPINQFSFEKIANNDLLVKAKKYSLRPNSISFNIYLEQVNFDGKKKKSTNKVIVDFLNNRSVLEFNNAKDFYNEQVYLNEGVRTTLYFFKGKNTPEYVRINKIENVIGDYDDILWNNQQQTFDLLKELLIKHSSLSKYKTIISPDKKTASLSIDYSEIGIDIETGALCYIKSYNENMTPSIYIEYKNYAHIDGFYVPSSVISHVFHENKEFKSSYSIDIDSIKINADYPKETFTPSINAGTLVVDEIMKKKYLYTNKPSTLDNELNLKKLVDSSKDVKE